MNAYTLLPQIMVQVLFVSSNFSPQPLNKTGVYYLKFSKFFGWWILMTAGSAHIADLIDTVHDDMDSVVHGHHVINQYGS